MKHVVISIPFFLVLFALGAEYSDAQQPGNGAEGWVEVLRDDVRLRASVTLKSESWPTAAALLELLRKATGVPLFWAGEGDQDKVNFGTTAVINVPAWKVMQQLAATEVTGGKWERTPDGYELHGTPKQFGPGPEYARSEKGKDAKATVEEYRLNAQKMAADFAKWHPLAADSRLRTPLRLVETQPPLVDILGRLTVATRLEFKLAENLADHKLDLGELALSKVAAYSVMELIAERQLENGRWEKTDSGYCLVGKSLVPLPPSPPVRWPIVVAVVTAGALAFGFLVIRYRRLPPRRLS